MLRSKFMYQLPSCPCFLHVCPQSAAEATRHALKCAPGPAADPFQSSHIRAPSSHTWAHAAAVADHCIYSCFWSNLLLFIFVSLLVYNVLLMLLSSEAQLLRNWPLPWVFLPLLLFSKVLLLLLAARAAIHHSCFRLTAQLSGRTCGPQNGFGSISCVLCVWPICFLQILQWADSWNWWEEIRVTLIFIFLSCCCLLSKRLPMSRASQDVLPPNIICRFHRSPSVTPCCVKPDWQSWSSGKIQSSTCMIVGFGGFLVALCFQSPGSQILGPLLGWVSNGVLLSPSGLQSNPLHWGNSPWWGQIPCMVHFVSSLYPEICTQNLCFGM